jgi:hypothetical protein
MRSKVILFLLAISCYTLHASLIKGKARIYTLPSRTPFAMLYDSSYVMQAWNWKWKQPFIDFQCFVKKSHLADGKLVTRTINFDYGGGVVRPTKKIIMTDTVYLYSDTSLQQITGYAWPTSDSSAWINFQQSDPYKHENTRLNYLECWLYGGIDSSSILEFDPWNGIIRSLSEKRNLFKISFNELNQFMSTIHSYCTQISRKGIEYSETYDEDNPTPGIALLYLFRDGILKAIWTEFRLNENNAQIFERGYIYFDDSVRSSLSKIKTKFKQRLHYTP